MNVNAKYKDKKVNIHIKKAKLKSVFLEGPKIFIKNDKYFKQIL